MDTTSIYYIEVNAICIVLMAILFVSMARVSSGKRELFFRLLLISTVLICASDAVAGVCRGKTFDGARVIIWASNLIYFTASFAVAYLWVLYAMYVLTDKIHKVWAIVIGAITGVSALIFLTAPINGWAFTIDANNLYSRGPLIWLQWIIIFPSMILPSLIAPFTKAEKNEKRAIASFSLLPLVTAIIQAVAYGVTVTQVGIVGGLLMIYVMLQSKVVNDAVIRAELLDEISNTDTLTGLKNRRAYETRIESLQSAEWVAVLFIDLNGLKKVNDTEGHKAGDDFIINFVELIKKHFSKDDLFRISGDEFVALFENRDEYLASCAAVIDEIGDAGSAGFAEGQGTLVLELLKQAEEMMYERKSHFYKRKGVDRRR